MLKKWKTNRPFQNWKKAVAVFLWHWIVLFAVAQTFPNLPEISVSDGLPTASTRRIIETNSGSVLIATDAGLHYAPKEQPSLEKIKVQVGTQQCWDLHLNQNTLTIATYNDGLYVFDISNGNLIQHFKKEQLNKIRRLREINGKLYCIARQGIYEIKGNKALLRFSTALLPVTPKDSFCNNKAMDPG
jgi:ligand-binding sensor domain-containing protein